MKNESKKKIFLVLTGTYTCPICGKSQVIKGEYGIHENWACDSGSALECCDVTLVLDIEIDGELDSIILN